MKRVFLFFVLLGLTLTGCCSIDNNEYTILDLQRHMMQGTGAAFCCVMRADAAHAESGFSLTISDRQVAFYKYNQKRAKQRKHLDFIRETGKLYIVGKPYHAIINGSFVMIDADTNRSREILEKAFKSFPLSGKEPRSY